MKRMKATTVQFGRFGKLEDGAEFHCDDSEATERETLGTAKIVPMVDHPDGLEWSEGPVDGPAPDAPQPVKGAITSPPLRPGSRPLRLTDPSLA